MHVAVIGLGSMGGGAARNLAAKGHDVVGCEARAGVRDAFAADGIRCVATPAELPDDLDALVVFVVDAAQVEAVLFGPDGCARSLPPGCVVLLCATLAPAAARQFSARLGSLGLPVLDAPVSGGSAGAAAGTMTVMASGGPEAFAAAGPVLDAIAGRVWRLGDAPGAGSTVKMVNQLLAGVHIAAAAEAMALGIRAGADPRVLYDVICSSAGNSWMFQNRVPHILDGDDTPRSTTDIFVKDLGIVLDGGRSLTLPLPLAAAAHQLFLAESAAGGGQRDDAFVIRFWQRLAGIELPSAEEPG